MTANSHISIAQRSQSGVALLIALIVLVAMSLAGVALIRSVDTNALVASNLTFRQNAQYAADTGVEAAIAWLSSGATPLDGDSSGNGYYSTREPTVDLTGNVTNSTSDDVRWIDNDGTVLPGVATPKCLNRDDAGNRVCYIVHRMCKAPGPVDLTNCGVYTSYGAGPDYARKIATSQGLLDPQMKAGRAGDDVNPGSTATTTYAAIYRITVRSAGPRNNISFVQVYVAI